MVGALDRSAETTRGLRVRVVPPETTSVEELCGTRVWVRQSMAVE